jgi:S1/P1 Nuclease
MNRLFVVLLLCLLAAPAAFGWNQTGHRIVAEIAWRDLSAPKRAAISKLLAEHPHYWFLLATNIPPEAGTNQWAFLNSAVWPDMVRPARGAAPEKSNDITKYHRSSWHYVNLPYVLPKDAGQISAADFSANPTNILWALSNNIAILQNRHATPADRAVSLCWVAHLVGDLHQPLHAATLLSALYPHGDQGGNLLAICDTSEVPMNLHSYWDQLMGNADSYVAVALLSDAIANAAENQPRSLPEYKEDKTLRSWVNESYAAAISFAYAEGQLRFADWRSYDSGALKNADVPRLRATYILNANTIGRRRLALAGHRLGDLLKESF